jgi:hypothetical protein
LIDYFRIVNKQVEFDEFKEIMKASFREECKNPYFVWKNKIPDDSESSNNQLTPETFLASEVNADDLIPLGF